MNVGRRANAADDPAASTAEQRHASLANALPNVRTMSRFARCIDVRLSALMVMREIILLCDSPMPTFASVLCEFDSWIGARNPVGIGSSSAAVTGYNFP
jgi:hypothetical protein